MALLSLKGVAEKLCMRPSVMLNDHILSLQS
jgi:hypothetical protein